MRPLTFFGGPADGRIKPSHVHKKFDTLLAFAKGGVYEVIADIALFDELIMDEFPRFPISFENTGEKE